MLTVLGISGVEALGPSEPGADQLNFLLCRRDAVLGAVGALAIHYWPGWGPHVEL
jgi:hypothetical protein